MDDFRHLVDVPEIWRRLEEVEGRLLEVSTSLDPYMTQISQHLLRAGGKRPSSTVGPASGQFGVCS